MAPVKVKRLSKVAREFNLGLMTIVEFLGEKGHEIDANPNTKISPDLYTMLVDEFQGEKSLKERSEKVVVGKDKKETISLVAETKEEAPAEKESVEKAAEPVKAEEPVQPKEEKKEEVVKAKDSEEKVGLKVVGKIDLKEKKKEKAKKTEEVKEEPVAEKPVAEEPKTEEKVEEKKEVEGDDKSVIKATIDKIDGPKVVGKIDLPEKVVKKKPVASSSGDNTQKKKRRRIRKEVTPGKVNVDQKAGGFRKGAPANKKGGPRRPAKAELTEEEIQKQIKETLARLSGGKGKNKSAKFRRNKRDAVGARLAEEQEKAEQEKSILKATEFVSANELATMMDVSVNDIISACMSLGLFVSINQRLDAETITIVAEEFGYEVEFVGADDTDEVAEEEDNEEDLIPRAPIVTVMGHVDHGKTSLLDYIRNENVIAGEAGGITQHIGSYAVTLKSGHEVTFLDTPGHEAFTAMRARGAKVTDLAIIVIAADDNVMPQTKEAINHAQAAGVPMIFAINKIDKDGANPEKIKEELANMNILVEDWGGKFQCQHISAKQGTNIDDLLEKVVLEAELMELKANPNKDAVGTVVESSLDKGRGYVCSVLVQAGTLNVGDMVVAGCYSGKVKAMTDERGHKVKSAGPSHPVQLLGLNGAPQAGDKFNVYKDEKEAKDVAAKRLQIQREQGIRTQKHLTLDEIGRRIAIGDFQEFNIIVKGDVDGSIEALSDSLLKLSTEQIQVNIIHKSVGQISESDILLASASDAIIIGFQVRPSVGARKLAEEEEIEIRLYSIIYAAIEEIKDAMEGMLKPKIEEKITANVEIREVFKISKVGTVAGCFVLDGKVFRNSMIRVIRDGIVIHTGVLGSLKRFKDDVKEVQHGYECGLNIDKFEAIKVGDIIEAYEEVEVKQTLKS